MSNLKLNIAYTVIVIVFICVMYIISRDCGWLNGFSLREYFGVGTKTGDIFPQPKFVSLYGTLVSGEKIDELIENVIDVQITNKTQVAPEFLVKNNPAILFNTSTKTFTLTLNDRTTKTFGPILEYGLEYSVIDNVQLC